MIFNPPFALLQLINEHKSIKLKERVLASPCWTANRISSQDNNNHVVERKVSIIS